MAQQVTITIDGVEVKTTPGKMILEAASDAGIYIPYLCYHPGMKPFGACRMCVVEIEGVRGTPASCTVPVTDGMVVKSSTDVVYDIRRGILEMEVAEHPHGCLTCHRVDLCGPEDICLRHVSVNDRCVTCPKNERCELKDTVRYHDMELESPLEYKYRNLPIEVGDPFYDRDYNLCIVCGRCVRVCEEVRGDDAICFVDRAGQALVGTSHGTSLLESGCEFCGACIDVCPVGALVESDNKWEKPKRVERTTCPHCPVGCQLNLEVNQFNKVIRSVPELTGPSNRGQACFKGKFGLNFVNHKERLRMPRIRRNGSLEEVSWEEALSYVAERLAPYQGAQFGILTSPKSTNEEHYLAQKFARLVMKSNNVDQSSNTRPEVALSLMETLGYAAATNTVWELEEAKCVLAFNTNVTEEHNVVAVPIKRATKKVTKLIVIDPREVELTRYAYLWLKPRPGTELLLLGGLLKSIVEQGLVQEEWVAEHCQGKEEMIEALKALDLDEFAEQCGVKREDIEEAARTYAASGPSAIIYALDNIPADLHRHCVYALSDMALLTGNLGKPSAGLYPLRPGTNEQGAYDMGCVPSLLPGYRSAKDVEASRLFEDAWGAPLPEERGLGLTEMVQAATQGKIKAMFLLGDSPTLTEGDLSALEKLEFLVVQDMFPSGVAQRAHVVLPAASFAEKEGTYTNLERRVQLLHPVIELKNSQARPEWWTLCQLAHRMGVGGFNFNNPAEILEEVAQHTPIYGGISMQRLESEAIPVPRPETENPLPTQVLYSDKEYRGLLWPCASQESADTPILYADSFPGGKAHLLVPDFRTVSLPTNSKYPLLLIAGRVLLQPERETEVQKGTLNQVRRDELLEMNPEDAAALGLSEGDPVEVAVNGHRLHARAFISEKTHRGTVSSTYLFGQLAVELQASKDPDPMSKAPGLSISAVRVEKAGHS